MQRGRHHSGKLALNVRSNRTELASIIGHDKQETQGRAEYSMGERMAAIRLVVLVHKGSYQRRTYEKRILEGGCNVQKGMTN